MGENLLCGRGALQGGEHSHSRVSFRGRRGKPTEQLLCGDLGSLLGETPTGARRGNANAASTGSASPPASHWPGPRSTPPMQMPLGGPPPQWGPHWLSHPSVCSGHPISPGGSPASQHSPRTARPIRTTQSGRRARKGRESDTLLEGDYGIMSRSKHIF